MRKIYRGCPHCKNDTFYISQKGDNKRFKYTCSKCKVMFPSNELCIVREFEI